MSMQTTADRHLPLVKLLWLGLGIAAAAAVITQVHELSRIAGAIASARWEFIALAATVEAAFVLNLALFYASSFRANRVRAATGRFLLLTSASHFVNLVSKTGGIGGIALYLREGRRTGESAARITAGYFTAYVLGYLAYFTVLIAALVLLYVRGSLSTAEAVAAGAIFAIVMALGGAAALGMRSEASLERMYGLATRPLNLAARMLRRPQVVDRAAAREHAAELYDAIAHMKQHPRSYVVPAAHALGVELLGVAVLYLVALALHADISFELALAAYAISLLFSMIAIKPAGLGFVEASLSVLLVSFGVGQTEAIAVALGFRLFDFWLPVALGALSLRLLRAAPDDRGEAR